jgi:hypothetical protein
MSDHVEYRIVINGAQRRLIMHALTNAMANDRRSTDVFSARPEEWMQLIRLFSMTKAVSWSVSRSAIMCESRTEQGSASSFTPWRLLALLLSIGPLANTALLITRTMWWRSTTDKGKGRLTGAGSKPAQSEAGGEIMKAILTAIMCVGTTSVATAQLPDYSTQWERQHQENEMRMERNRIDSEMQSQRREMEEMRIRQQNEMDRLRVEQEKMRDRMRERYWDFSVHLQDCVSGLPAGDWLIDLADGPKRPLTWIICWAQANNAGVIWAYDRVIRRRSIKKSSIFFPFFIAATSQRGFAPRPAQVSPLADRYFGGTLIPFNALPPTLAPPIGLYKLANSFSNSARRLRSSSSTRSRNSMSASTFIPDRFTLGIVISFARVKTH